MRYFVFLNQDNTVRSTVSTERIPGGGRELPADCREVTEQILRDIELSPGSSLINDVVIERVPRAPIVDLRTFFRLFTPSEVLAISGQREIDPEIAYFWMLLTLGRDVDLGHQDTADGLTMLVAKQVLTEERRAAILANQLPSK